MNEGRFLSFTVCVCVFWFGQHVYMGCHLHANDALIGC